MQKFFQRLSRGRDSEAEIARTQADMRSALDAAQGQLIDLEARYGQRLVAAKDAAEIEVIEAELAEKRRDVDRLTAASSAVSARLQALRAAEQRRDERQAWKSAEEALLARTEAIRKVDKKARELAAAVVEAERAAEVAFDSFPVRVVHGSPITREFAALDHLIQTHLSVLSAGRLGPFRGSAVWEAAKRPGLVDHAIERAAFWMSARDDADRPEAAA